jgi:hypothetical protein
MITKVGIRAKTNAFPIMRYSSATKPALNMIARAAPNPAPEVIPKVIGLASGFLKIPCSIVPAIASPIPAKIPIKMRGSLNCHTHTSASHRVWK